MKIIILLSTLIFSVTAFAETEANWFSPGCKDCPAMQMPGRARLSNNVGVLNSKTIKTKKRGTPGSTTAPVSK